MSSPHLQRLDILGAQVPRPQCWLSHRSHELSSLSTPCVSCEQLYALLGFVGASWLIGWLAAFVLNVSFLNRLIWLILKVLFLLRVHHQINESDLRF